MSNITLQQFVNFEVYIRFYIELLSKLLSCNLHLFKKKKKMKTETENVELDVTSSRAQSRFRDESCRKEERCDTST